MIPIRLTPMIDRCEKRESSEADPGHSLSFVIILIRDEPNVINLISVRVTAARRPGHKDNTIFFVRTTKVG